MIDTSSPSTVVAAIGYPLTLFCISRGSPPDTFTWRKNDSVLQSTTTPLIYNASIAVFHADYSIDNVTTSDSGTYTCIITNPIGSGNTTITVVVGKLPMLIFNDIAGICTKGRSEFSFRPIYSRLM